MILSLNNKVANYIYFTTFDIITKNNNVNNVTNIVLNKFTTLNNVFFFSIVL